MDKIEWDFIDCSTEEGNLLVTETLLRHWAYAENGYFTDQDEDLLLYRPELILPMYRLLADDECNRQRDLFLTLRSYAEHSFTGTKSNLAIAEFKELFHYQVSSKWQKELIKKLKLIAD